MLLYRSLRAIKKKKPFSSKLLSSLGSSCKWNPEYLASLNSSAQQQCPLTTALAHVVGLATEANSRKLV